MQLTSLDLTELNPIALDALIKYLYGHDYSDFVRFDPHFLDTPHVYTFQEHVDTYFLATEHKCPGLQILASRSATSALDCLTEPGICAEAVAIFDTIKTVLDRTGDDDRLLQGVLTLFQASKAVLNAKYDNLMAALERSHSRFGMKVNGWGPAVTDSFG